MKLLKWLGSLRDNLNAPYADVAMTDEEAAWWGEAKKAELRRTRWARAAQVAAMCLGPMLPNILGESRHPLWRDLLVTGAMFAVMYLVMGVIVGRTQLQAARVVMLPQYRLRKALLAELAEPATTGSLERHDVP